MDNIITVEQAIQLYELEQAFEEYRKNYSFKDEIDELDMILAELHTLEGVV